MTRQTKNAIDRAVGEVLAFLPIVILSVFLGIHAYLLIAMVVFFFGKWHYQTDHYLHLPFKQCFPISLSLFVAIAVLTVGITTVFPLGNQPMIPIALAACATWAYAIASDVQLKLQPPLFDPTKATRDQMELACIMLGIPDEEIPVVYDLFRTKLTNEQIAEKYHMSPRKAAYLKRRAKDGFTDLRISF